MIKNYLLLVGALLSSACVGCRRGGGLPAGYQGVVEYDERVLSFEVGGRVAEVKVREGDAAFGGEVLARVDDALQRLTRDARGAEAEAARAELALLEAGARNEDVAALSARARAAAATEDLGRKSLERVAALHESGALASAELDRAEAERARAGDERRSLEQQLLSLRRGARPQEIDRARARAEASAALFRLEGERLGRYELRAPLPCVVVERHIEPGEFAAPGAPALTVADTAHPYVDMFVPEGELARVRVGAGAKVRADALAEPLAGHVEHVGTRVEFTPRFLFSERERPNLVVRVRVRVDDPERRLPAGVPAFVEVAP